MHRQQPSAPLLLFFLSIITFSTAQISADDTYLPSYKLMAQIRDKSPHVYRELKQTVPRFFSHAISASELNHDFFDKCGKMIGIDFFAALVIFLSEALGASLLVRNKNFQQALE